MGQDRKFTE